MVWEEHQQNYRRGCFGGPFRGGQLGGWLRLGQLHNGQVTDHDMPLAEEKYFEMETNLDWRRKEVGETRSVTHRLLLLLFSLDVSVYALPKMRTSSIWNVHKDILVDL